jgi:hypothetical protein
MGRCPLGIANPKETVMTVKSKLIGASVAILCLSAAAVQTAAAAGKAASDSIPVSSAHADVRLDPTASGVAAYHQYTSGRPEATDPTQVGQLTVVVGKPALAGAQVALAPSPALAKDAFADDSISASDMSVKEPTVAALAFDVH